MKGIDGTMASFIEQVEKDGDGKYELEDMTEQTKSMAVRLYALLTSYLRHRQMLQMLAQKD